MTPSEFEEENGRKFRELTVKPGNFRATNHIEQKMLQESPSTAYNREVRCSSHRWTTTVRDWRNGSRSRLKICWSYDRTSSNLVSRTKLPS